MVNIKIKRHSTKPKYRTKSITPCQSGWTTNNPWITQPICASKIKTTNTNTTTFSLNKNIILKQNIQNLRSSLAKRTVCTSIPKVRLQQEPFQLCVVEDFLSNSDNITLLYEEMKSLNWNTRKMDLYELYQSPDLSSITTEYLKQFYTFLETDVKDWMSQITGFEFTKVSATCSMYNSTNYLLPHDDLLEDRLVAFVFYICPWKLMGDYTTELIEAGWSTKMGGNLKLFTVNKYNEPVHPAVDKISPRNNQFLFFKVSQISYHEVEEVFTNDYSRLSINGWFHGPRKENLPDIIKNNNLLKNRHKIAKIDCDLKEFVDSSYLTNKIKKEINAQIEENSEISLAKFFKQEMYNTILGLLTSNKVQWTRVGPVNKCNYEIAVIGKLYDFLYSDSFITLLKEYTDLDLPLDAFSLKDLSDIQIQRWTAGCYTLIHDKSEYDCDALDVILYFNCDENSAAGSITYLDPGEAEENVLLTIYPKNNTMNIVYRTSGTCRFTKYVNHKMMECSKYFYIVSCQFKQETDILDKDFEMSDN